MSGNRRPGLDPLANHANHANLRRAREGTSVSRELVIGPDSVDWKVRLVWEPRWNALSRRYGGWRRDRSKDGPDFTGLDYVPDVPAHSSSGSGGFFDDLGDDLAVAVLVIVGVIVVGALFWWLILPLLLIVVDLLVVLALLFAGVVARVALGRPWTIEAIPRRGPRIEQHVKGLNAARRAKADLIVAIKSGAIRADRPFTPDLSGT